MNLDAHKKLLEKLRADDPDVILDGPIVPSNYLVAMPRIMWVLREAHDGDGNLKDYCLFVDKQLLDYPRWGKTLGIVAKVSDGIMRGCDHFEKLTNNKFELNMRLRHVAIVNVNKVAGDKRVNRPKFEKQAEKYAQTIIEQIKLLDPHMVIFAGTLDWLKWTLNKEMVGFPDSPGSSLYLDGRLYLRAYHPNQRKVPHQKYYEKIQDDVQRLLVTTKRPELKSYIASLVKMP